MDRSSIMLTAEQQLLVENSLEFVHWTIARLIPKSNCHMEYDDLFQGGCVALCHAAASYHGGTSFKTYAITVIRNHLIDCCRKQTSWRKYISEQSLDDPDAGLPTPFCTDHAHFSGVDTGAVLTSCKKHYLYLSTSSSARDLELAFSSMQPAKFEYPVDGLIMEYDDLAYGKSLGATGHHENRLIALKWADELYETTFRSVELATTRTGMVSLTARFDPVNMDGATVSRAYLHNLDNFRALQLGSGDTVRVYRANMIIPQIADNLTKSGTYLLSMSCPCCGAALEVGETTGGTHQLFCRNRSCTAKLVQKFVHFCDKSRMNMEGLSETTLEKLIGHGWVHTFADLYDLEQHRDAIIQTDGFGEKSFERLQAAIEKSRSCTLAKFIAGLGIPTIGRHAGQELDRCFAGSWEAFEAAIQKGFDFTQLPDFGAVMQENIYTWYADTEEAKLWRPLLDKIHFIKETTPMSITKESPLYGKIVVATGKLEHYTRDGIQSKLLQLGAIPASSVTKKTNYLIVGEKAGSKLAKAQQLGVPTLTEEEFEALLAG